MPRSKINITGNRLADAVLMVFAGAAVMHVGILAINTISTRDIRWLDMINLLELNLVWPGLIKSDVTFWVSGILWLILIVWVYKKIGNKEFNG